MVKILNIVKDKTKLIAQSQTEVFVENTLSGFKNIPKDRQNRVSWKGCYYIIEPGEEVIFDRTNDWDRSYFKLSNGAEFMIWVGKPELWTERNNFKISKT